MSVMPCISVLVPAYEMNGSGAALLRRCLKSILEQDISHDIFDGVVEIVVSDQSKDGSLSEVCREQTVPSGFTLRCVPAPSSARSASSNLNAAFGVSMGRLVKILFQDDLLVSRRALLETLEGFESHPARSWLLCGSTHTRDGDAFFNEMVPRLHDRIHFGVNTVSSPSVLALRRSAWVPFDPNLRWLMDVDAYKSLQTTWGPPVILESVHVANGIGEHQVSAQGISPSALFVERLRVARRHESAWVGIMTIEALMILKKLVRRATIQPIRRIPKRTKRRLYAFVHSIRSGPRAPEPAESLPRVEVINRVIQSIGAKRYLEIGVNTAAQPGYSRDKVRVDVKHGVDPNPLTDADFIMTSDEFFATNQETYDVVFVDGLHLFEQALRDCLNALDALEPGGVVILHDTRPSNSLSASRVPGQDKKWHGDVWRAVVILRLLRPWLSVMTLDSDEGLTFVREPREKEAPVRLSGLPDDLFAWSSYVAHHRDLLSVIDARRFMTEYPIG